MPRRIARLAIVALLATVHPREASAHAGPRLTDPIEGATLGDTPAVVRLSFSERPEPSLSQIRVLDTGGAAYQVGSTDVVPGDPLALSVRVKPLGRGVYVVSWRIVSAVDGHVTAGAYAFGVQTSPIGAFAASTTYPSASRLELIARWTFMAGLVTLLGALSAAMLGFGGTRDLTLAAGGWVLAIVGVSLLTEAQRRAAGASFSVFLGASLGRTFVWRTAGIGAAGIAIIAAHYGGRWAQRTLQRIGLAIALLATLAAIAIHVAAGHAAATGRGFSAAAIAGQWSHIGAAGLWVGGLAALLLGVRGAPSDRKAEAVRRFSSIAAVSLVLVAATGLARTISALTSWSDMISTAYGRVVLAKVVLMLAIAAFGAVNRRWSVPAAATNLRPLRRTASGELTLMTLALAAAALLATLPPPVSAQAGLAGLEVSGADFGTTVRVRLTTVSDQPGPNRFVLFVVDYDSKRAIAATRVSLRFTPLDDPGVASTSLQLVPGPNGAFVGSGANLSFDGRWQVTALIERAGDSIEVPLELETRAVWRPYVFVARDPGQAPTYTVDVSGGTIRISPNPEREGPSKLYVTCYDQIGDPRPVDEIVVTDASANDSVARQLPVRRLSRGRFMAEVELSTGRHTIAAVGRTFDGTRLRAVFTIDVPRH